MSAGRAGVLVSDAAVSQIAATALAGLHGHGRPHACFGRRRAPFQDFRQTVSSLQSTPHRIHRGKQSVQHGLVAERGFAPLLDAVDAGLEQRHHVGGRELGLARTGRSRAEKNVPRRGPDVPPMVRMRTLATF